MRHLLLMIALVVSCGIPASAQKKSTSGSKKAAAPSKQSELAQLRDRYIATTKEYKASLQKLLTLYEDSLKKAEQRHENSQKLFDQGLISQRDLDESARIVTDANLKISTVQQEIAGADTQIAQALG